MKSAVALAGALGLIMCRTALGADGAGQATISPSKGLVAGRPYTFTIAYTYREPQARATDGRFGQAVIFSQETMASFGARGVLDIGEGAIELWVRPKWSADDGLTHRFFDCFRQVPNKDQASRIHLSKMATGQLRFQIYAHGAIHNVDFEVGERLRAGTWTHIAATWRTTDAATGNMEARVYLDGEAVAEGEFTLGERRPALDPTFSVGRADAGATEPAEAAIDELVVRGRWCEPHELALTAAPSAGERVTFLAHFDGDLTAQSAAGDVQEGMQPGGGLKIAIPRTWTKPQNRYPKQPGYVTATASEGTGVDLYFTDYRNIEWYIHAVTGGDVLTEGETITVTYGDRQLGSPGATIQPFPQDRWDNPRNHLAVHSDADGDGNYAELPEDRRYKLNIVAAPAAFLFVAAPSVVKAGEEFSLSVSAFDEFRNGANPAFEGEVTLKLPRGLSGPGSVRLRADDGNHVRVEGLRAERAGVYAVKASAGGIEGESNPIVCAADEPEYRIYWGDVHVHTSMSDGLLTADESYRHGRDLSALDFAAKTDHAEATTPEEWEETLTTAERFYDPGRFVTLCAYEWTSRLGHRNVYTPEKGLSYYSSGDARANTLTRFFSRLREDGVETIVVPHAILSSMKWDDYDQGISRLIEIYSMWGGGEMRNGSLWDKGQPGMSAREILATGARMGFIGSSDTHDGRPGRTSPMSRFTNLNHRGGLAAVWATELTRRGVFDALKARRTYATTGERIFVDFEVGGACMGEEISGPDAPPLTVHVVGTTDLAAVEVIRDGRVIYASPVEGREARFEFSDNDAPDECYYYLRVRQADGEVAWASPVWVSG